MKLLMVDFNSVDGDGYVRSHLDRANVALFMYDMVLAYDAEGCRAVAQVVSIYGDSVKVAVDPARTDAELVPA